MFELTIFAFPLTILAFLFQVEVSELPCALSEVCFEGPAEYSCAVKTAKGSHLAYRSFIIGDEHTTRFLKPDALHIVIDGLPGKRGEYPVKMEGGEVSHLCQIRQGMLFVEVGLDIIYHPVNPQVVFFS